MPQLNILPVNVSQNIEVKDDSTVTNSATENDDFSKYIDLHLIKNKGQDNNSKVDSKKIESDSATQKVSNSDEKHVELENNDLSEDYTIDDENTATKHTHKVAASGNKEQIIPNETDQKLISEPEELMSFLTKADNTLLADSADVSSITYQEQKLSAEPKTEYEAKLLLDSNNVDTDLSKVTKALRNAQIDASLEKTSKEQVVVKEAVFTSTAEANAVEASGDEKIKSDIQAQEQTSKTKPVLSELVNQAITETKSTDIESKEVKTNVDKSNVVLSDSTTTLKVDTKSGSAQEAAQTATVKNEVKATTTSQPSDQNLTSETSTDEEANLATKEQLVRNKFVEPNQVNTEKSPQSSLLQETHKGEEVTQLKQSINTDSVSDEQAAESNKVVAQPTSNNQIESDFVKPQGKSVDEIMLPRDSLKKIQSDKTLAQSDKALAQSGKTLAQSDKVPAQTEAQFIKKELAQGSETITATERTNQTASHLNKATAEVTDEVTQIETTKIKMTQSDKVQLTSVLDGLSQQKVATENKGVTSVESRTPGGIKTDLLTTPSVIDINGRASQVSQEIIDQQASEVLNPSVATEVSHNQKSNAQLHQETISLFRKDFSEAVKNKVMLMISQKLQQFDITLDPPELGNMQVRVNLQGEQASVNFLVQSQQTKDALEQNMHKLRELLGEQGVDVGDANVEQHSQQSANEDDSAAKNNNEMNKSIDKMDDVDDVVAHTLSAQMIDSSTTSVDYYA